MFEVSQIKMDRKSSGHHSKYEKDGQEWARELHAPKITVLTAINNTASLVEVCCYDLNETLLTIVKFFHFRFKKTKVQRITLLKLQNKLVANPEYV